MNLVTFQSRKIKGTQIPRYTNMVLLDIYQTEEGQILISEAPQATNISGIGRFNVLAKAGPGLSDTAEVFVTLDDMDTITSELTANPDLAEGSSNISWIKVGDAETNSDGYFEFFSPIVALKIKFVGVTGGKVTLALN